MAKRKSTKKYYFSVEGETEQWYLKWLQDTINSTEEAAFQEHFDDMDEFKKEANFKRCLGKLQLSDVVDAIARAKRIEQMNRDNGYTLQQHRGYRYYRENPSLSSWEAIEKILKDCKLI